MLQVGTEVREAVPHAQAHSTEPRGVQGVAGSKARALHHHVLSPCDALQESTSAICPLQRLTTAGRCGPGLDFQSFSFLSMVITV